MNNDAYDRVVNKQSKIEGVNMRYLPEGGLELSKVKNGVILKVTGSWTDQEDEVKGEQYVFTSFKDLSEYLKDKLELE